MKPSNFNAYLRTKVLTASPAELRLMLLDGAIRFAEQAKAGLASKDYEASYNGVTRCQNILMELLNALRPEHDAELCKRLSGLYSYMFTQLMKASSERNLAIYDEVLNLLQYERQTWAMLLEQLAQENKAAQGMQNTPDAVPSRGAEASESAKKLVGGAVSLRG